MSSSRLLLFIGFLLIVAKANAQFKDNYNESKDGTLVVGTQFLTNIHDIHDNLPFWLHADQYGLYHPYSANGVLTASFYQPVVSNEQFSIYTSGMLANRYAGRSWTGLPFLSATVNIGPFQLRGGRFSDPIGTNYHPLSSGSLLYSTNALPVPKILVKTNGFVDIPGTYKHLQFSAYLSHGWLENSRYARNAYLHQKYLYLKLEFQPIQIIGGIVHNVQWGGTSPVFGRLPDSFGDYLRVFFNENANANSDAPDNEKMNTIGNVVAGYDFNLRINLNSTTLSFYRLFYLEAATKVRSIWDGMWGGAYISRESHPFLNAFVYEYINTKSGNVHDSEPRGAANYYNNGIYESGWTYMNRVLGNPLILTDGSNQYPIYNNIIVAHHLAAQGFIRSHMQWKVYYTYSRNYGRKDDQIIPGTAWGWNPLRADLYPIDTLKKVNHSFYFSTVYTPPAYKRFQFELGFAGDFGQLYASDRLGIMFGASYRVY